ncbi:ABC transporter ATP-binding protein [Nitratireductor aquimarinus]|uniref:ABC transporter ATP-binding protein n=1 Tax=Nitratireductor aquimarinus TaxID=889300 RepID=UPI00398F2481
MKKGHSLGLVGESGCGKSTLARIATGFQRPSLGQVSRAPDMAGRAVQMVFQDPLSALDPRMKIGAQVEEVIALTGRKGREAIDARRDELLRQVGLGQDFTDRFPNEISGGQRQRAVIARALAADPKLLVCDEPLAALDLSLQAQMLALLAELKDSLGLSMLFISHQLPTVRFLCDEVAVMYAGRIIEQGPTERIFAEPQHPYTRMLLSTMLDPLAPVPQFAPVMGEPPNPIQLPPGCPFHPRCAQSLPGHCDRVRPETAIGPKGRVACHLANEAKAA